MRIPRVLVALTAAATALVLVSPGSAAARTGASGPTVSDPIVTGLAGPLQIAVSGDRIYVGQAFAALLTKVRANGSTVNLTSAGDEIAGVAVRRHTVAFTTSTFDPAAPGAALMVRWPDGTVRQVADLYDFEVTHNPDHRNTYGFIGLSKWCADQVPAEMGGGYPYSGIVESHPYAVANAPGGGWYVADAAANTILKVSRGGHISVVAVPRPQPTKISKEVAEAFGLPHCTVGKRYAFEPVPTDVEVGKSGALFASLLPGGPEDASLGARGSVIWVGRYGQTATIARGFLGATNIALGCGRIFVSEMFANRISVIDHGKAKPLVDLPTPAGLEFANGKLYASYDVFGSGSIATIRP